jgi:hypothetical protein
MLKVFLKLLNAISNRQLIGYRTIIIQLDNISLINGRCLLPAILGIIVNELIGLKKDFTCNIWWTNQWIQDHLYFLLQDSIFLQASLLPTKAEKI